MARIPIEMPKLNYEMETGVVQAWRCRIGDHVEKGSAVVEIESEKAAVDVVAPLSGSLVEIVHDIGAEVPVGTAIGWLDVEG
jgi:pyruvate/2-oxoglutarate dehydrogenase complex dihydrolipoamide acyltransferase (E2) component